MGSTHNSKSRISAELLDRYLTGTCDDAERARVAAWMAEAPHRTLRDRFRLGAAVTPEEIASAFERLRRGIGVDGARETNSISLSNAAAADAHDSKSFIWRLRGTRWQTRAAVAGVMGFAMVAVFGGTVHNGSSLLTGLFASSGRSRSTPAASYVTHVGQMATMTLNDGSRVTLAPQTTLTIATGFGTTSRDVVLDGEAYFELRNGSSSLPFVVHTGVVTTRVLGTAFNVRRYPTDTHTRVSVTSGKVSVVAQTAWRPSVTLTAGGIADVTDSTTGIVSTDSAARNAQWTAGTLVFDEAPIPEILTTLSRWYGYEFRLTDSTMAKRKLTAWFATHAPEEALSDLKALLEVELKFDGNIVTLIPRARKSSWPAIQNEELSHTRTEVGR